MHNNAARMIYEIIARNLHAKSFICDGAMHINQNEREIYVSQLLRDMRGFKGLREQAACFILYISCFSPSVPLLRCGG
jgi:hypothetical protein